MKRFRAVENAYSRFEVLLLQARSKRASASFFTRWRNPPAHNSAGPLNEGIPSGNRLASGSA